MIEIFHKITCDICGESPEPERIVHVESYDLPKPIIPYDWQRIDNRIVCPKHEIKKVLFIDGKEVL